MWQFKYIHHVCIYGGLKETFLYNSDHIRMACEEVRIPDSIYVDKKTTESHTHGKQKHSLLKQINKRNILYK